ncbi:MAG: DUF3459 domain-containing protein, partial [Oscillibacter sp.]|nr:DUF3459 domain-containing protein [Oscillibacter sp.]
TGTCFRGAQGLPFIGGEAERNGTYILNFFKCQPALNYGFQHVTESWQCPADHPAAIATREAMKDIMRFWLSQGCDGFRVDMADSLVKYDDADKRGTSAVWRDVREMLDREFPEAALVSEWNNPFLALPAGFDMDFYLNWKGNGYSALLRDYENWDNEDHSYFKKDGNGRIDRFLDEYLPRYEGTRKDGYISLITGNHDTPRLGYTLDQTELKLALAFLFTMPGVPFLYYGDEIGMRYRNLPTKEGGYARTGSRTPMQWSRGRNLGFSTCPPEDLYLPVDPAPDAPTVEEQERDGGSLLHTVRAVLALRHQEPDLQADGDFQVLCREAGKPFVYRRGNLLLAVNPSGEKSSLAIAFEAHRTLLKIGGGGFDGGLLTLAPQSFLVMG